MPLESTSARWSTLPAYPSSARRLAGTASWARRLGEDDSLANVRDVTTAIARRWPNALTEAVDTHVNALQSWRRNSLEEAEKLLLNSSGSAFSIWSVFDLAELFTTRGKWELAEAYWEKLFFLIFPNTLPLIPTSHVW